MRLFFTITILFSLLTYTSQAQVVEKTEEKAKQKSEKRLDEKIDNGIDSGLDAIEGLFSKKKKKKKEPVHDEETEEKSSSDDAMNAAIMKMMGSSDVDVKENYSFDHRFIILMEEIDKKGRKTESNEMVYLIKEGSPVMGLEMEQEGTNTEVIYDLENYEIISLINTEGQKIGTTMSLDKEDMDAMIEESMEDGDDDPATGIPQFVKTGKTKEISGYSCDEYKVNQAEGMEGEVTYWITDEAEVDWISSMSSMSGLNQDLPSVYAGTGYPENGAVIQMIFSETNGSGSIMTVKEIQKDQNVEISTSGYTFMNLPGGR